ncbi:MAG: hypothetical protein WCR52_01885 [Bacteroidota bacterium]
MTDSKDYRSIDELFKRTFDELPDAPSAGGWDVPSDKVWEHVQTRIQTPKSGWTAQTLALVSAFAVVLLIGLYFLVASGSDKQENKAATETANSTANVSTSTTAAPIAPAVAPVMAPATQTETVALEKAAPRVATTPKAPKKTEPFKSKMQVSQSVAAPEKPAHNEAVNHADAPARPSGALPLPGTKPASPNSTVAKHRASWQKPLHYLPVLRSKPTIPVAPASLRVKTN